MKKTIFIIAVVLLLLIIAVALVKLRGNEDNWICQNGQWVKHGNPASPMPSSSCGEPTGGQTGGQGNDRRLIGGDKDDHGCLIGGAGTAGASKKRNACERGKRVALDCFLTSNIK